jgi:adenosylmethionine-8-amino-7-oxononanoate aminotransferase
MDDLAALDRAHLWHPFTQHQIWDASPPLIIARAEGCWLVDTDGNRYLDGVSSLWTNVHGHRHPALDAAVRDQLDRIAHSTLLGLSHPPAIRLAARLAALTGLPRVFFSDNGSTAVEVALKMAFQYQQQTGATGRTRFASLTDAYHGDTVGAVSVGNIDRFHAVYRPLLFDAVALPAPLDADEEAACLEVALARITAAGPTLAAFVFEPLVQGAAGMKMHSPAFLRALCEAARAQGALLIADEVATGFGRTGTMFAVEQAGIQPDFLCLAKGLAGGYLPIAATLATQAVFDAFVGPPEAYRQLFHGHTFTGNPLACAVALASLDLFESEDRLAHVRALALHLTRRLQALATRPGVGKIRHKGVLVGIELVQPDGTAWPTARLTGHRAAMACRPRGAVVRPLGDVLVLNPPLAISHAELDQLLDAVEGAIDEAGRP